MKLKFLFIFAIFCVFNQSAFAQIDDPLQKPEIWLKVIDSPSDSAVWVEYLGKTWVKMTPKEKQNINFWKQEISTQSFSSHTSTTTKKEDKANEDELFKASDIDPLGVNHNTTNPEIHEKQKYYTQLEEAILHDNLTIAQLKANIIQNFIILEEAYEEEFHKYGGKYLWYDDVYADGKYSQIQWINDQDSKLKTLKQAHIQRIKSGTK